MPNVPENIAQNYIYYLDKFNDDMTLDSKDIYKNILNPMCDALHDLVPFDLYNFKNVKNTHGGVSLKLTLLHGCFSRFWNCTNGTKSRNAPHVLILITMMEWFEI